MVASRDFLMVAGGRLVSALIAVVTIRVATSYLSPNQYGELALLIAVQLFCSSLIVSPVGQHINRHTHQWWDDGTLLSRLLAFRQYVLGASIIGALLAYTVVAQESVFQSVLMASVVVLTVNAATWNATSIFMLNMLGFRGYSVMWATVTALSGLIASVILVTWFPGALAWFCGQALGMTIGAFGAGYSLRRNSRHARSSGSRFPLLDRHSIVSYCLPLAIATGLMWIQMSGYRFVVHAYWGVELLGYAAVGLLLATQIWTIVESLSQQFLFPLFFRRINQADAQASRDAMSDLLNIMGPLYLVLAGMAFLGAPHILKLLTAPQYADAEIFVRFGVAIETCRVLINLLGNAAQVTKKTQSVMLPYAAGAIVCLGVMLLAGIQNFGINWVGIALSIAAAVTLLTMSVSMYRQLAYRLDVWRWLGGAFAMALMGFAACWLERPDGWAEALGILIAIGLAGVAVSVRLLWGNAALHRMLSVDLRGIGFGR